MDALGLAWLRAEFASAGKPEPELFKDAGNAFYKSMKRGVMIPSVSKHSTRVPVPRIPGQIVLADCTAVAENLGARARDLGDGVLCLEFSGKMNTLGAGTRVECFETDGIITP